MCTQYKNVAIHAHAHTHTHTYKHTGLPGCVISTHMRACMQTHTRGSGLGQHWMQGGAFFFLPPGATRNTQATLFQPAGPQIHAGLPL